MNSAIERLLSLRVADIMTRNVVQVSSHDTMAEAARLFDEKDISGAPVIDEEGRCVGVLTATDFVLREKLLRTSATQSPSGGVEHVLVQDAPDAPYHVEEVAEDLVSAHMSTAVQTVRETTTMMEAARAMCGEHIHRLVVLDNRERPLGIVSSLDLVAAMVHAIEE